MYGLYVGLHYNHRIFIASFESPEEAIAKAKDVAKTVAPGRFIIQGPDTAWGLPGGCMEVRVERDGTVVFLNDRDDIEGCDK